MLKLLNKCLWEPFIKVLFRPREILVNINAFIIFKGSHPPEFMVKGDARESLGVIFNVRPGQDSGQGFFVGHMGAVEDHLVHRVHVILYYGGMYLSVFDI